MDETYLLGMDLGTSTVKASLYTPDGREVAVAADEYLSSPEGTATAELDPEDLWQGICRVVRTVLGCVEGAADRIAGLSMSSHAETLVMLRRDGSPARPAIFTTDARADVEAREIAAHFGSEWVLDRTGQPDVVGIWPACKIAWLRRHEPAAFADVAHYMMPEDYVYYRLTGELSGEVTAWLSSIMVDVSARDWLDPMLEYVGLERGQLPPLMPSGQVMGRVLPEAAQATGLRAGTPVIVGAMDQMCAAVAAGNTQPGVVSVSTGSVLALVATTEKPIFDHNTRISCYTHVVPGAYALLPWNPTGGLVLKWFKDRFGETEQAEAARLGISVYDHLCDAAAAVPPGCDGLSMVPHLQGVLYPDVGPGARGAFYGFGLGHGRAHFTRAILEAVAFMLREALEGLTRLGVDVRNVCVLGGGARSALWAQIKADVCQRPLVLPLASEAALQGAAMLASVGAGVHADLSVASTAMVKTRCRVEPNAELAPTYDAAFARYQALYRQLRPLFGLTS